MVTREDCIQILFIARYFNRVKIHSLALIFNSCMLFIVHYSEMEVLYIFYICSFFMHLNALNIFLKQCQKLFKAFVSLLNHYFLTNIKRLLLRCIHHFITIWTICAFRVLIHKITISINFFQWHILMLWKGYEWTEVDRRNWLHVPLGTHWTTSSDNHQIVDI